MSKKAKNRALRRRAIQAADATVRGSLEFTAEAIIAAGTDATDDQPRKLPTIQVSAYNGGAMRVRNYSRPVVVDVAGVEGLGRPIPLYRGHDDNRIVGHGVASAEGGRITLSGTLSSEGPDAKEITTLAANGFPWQASIGLDPSKVQHVNAGSKTTVNGQEIEGPVSVVRAGKLYEISVVPRGADDTTAATVAASFGQDDLETETEIEEMETNSNPAELQATSNPAPIQADSIPGIKAERARREAIQAIAVEQARRGGDLDKIESMMSAAIEAGTNPQAFELEILRELRHSGVQAFARPDNAIDGQLIEAAIALECGGTVADQYSPELLQRAEDRFGGGLALGEVLRMSAKRNGYSAVSERFGRDLLRAAFAPVQARGASTYDLSGVLSNVANKAIRAGFDAVESSWRMIASVGSVRDFKQITRYALTGDFKFEQVGKGGELKNATMGEQSYTNQADTYGKMFAITRQDFINDDLGAFDRVRRLIGRGGALQFNQVFWTEFLADISTFWTTGQGNYFEGAATTLQSSSLTTAQKMLAEQTDPDGNLMGAMGKYLLVPSALEVDAEELYVSTNLNTGGSSTKDKVPNRNVFANKYQPVATPYIGAGGGITNGSDTHWFLLTDPADVPVIEAVFLNGRQQPTVEAAEADFDVLGVQMRGYWDFGINKQEYRGGVRSKGAA